MPSLEREIEFGVLADQTAQHMQAFIDAVQGVAEEGDPAASIPLLLLEVSRVFIAGSRLGAQRDIPPIGDYQPDTGMELDVESLRMKLAEMLGNVDTYSFVFDPYEPDVVDSQLSDDICAIIIDLDNGLRHYRNGNSQEALWWWQFSFVSNWGNLAGAVVNALLAVISHDRLDATEDVDEERVELAEEVLAQGIDRSAK
jgi:hypothetical protein